MRLVLYGGGDEASNLELDSMALKLTNKKKRDIKLAYIPSCSYDSHREFNAFASHYSKLGVRKIINFPIDTPMAQGPVFRRELLNCDLVHMGGGNTFYFLKYLRKYKMLSVLRRFAESGKVLTGLSAGAILMTPDIKTASYPSFDRDDNDENIRNLKALSLCRFEFFPHYRNSNRYSNALKQESMKTQLPIYACPDGHGILFIDDTLQFVGKSYVFFKGQRFSVF